MICNSLDQSQSYNFYLLSLALPPEKKERTVQKVSDFALSQFKFDSPCYDFFLIHLENKTFILEHLNFQYFQNKYFKNAKVC